MKSNNNRPRRFALDPIIPVLLTVILLALASHYIDMFLDHLGVPLAATIAAPGGFLFFYPGARKLTC